MKKFEVTVIKEDKYMIEIDENKFNQEWIKEFQEVFYSFDTLEEHAQHIAQHKSRFNQEYIEGYGAPLVDGRKPIFSDKDSVEPGINIVVLSEDDDIQIDSYEIQ